jgi:hypothetical protein
VLRLAMKKQEYLNCSPTNRLGKNISYFEMNDWKRRLVSSMLLKKTFLEQHNIDMSKIDEENLSIYLIKFKYKINGYD